MAKEYPKLYLYLGRPIDICENFNESCFKKCLDMSLPPDYYQIIFSKPFSLSMNYIFLYFLSHVTLTLGGCIGQSHLVTLVNFSLIGQETSGYVEGAPEAGPLQAGAV